MSPIDQLRFAYQTYPANQISATNSFGPKILDIDSKKEMPMVSAIMVTRGNIEFINRSIQMFLLQTWPCKELIIATDVVTEELDKLILTSGPDVRLVTLPLGLRLGDYRNIAIAKSRGDYICQWDDDDFYDSRRISVQMNILLESSVDIVFLSRWLVWWQAKSLFFISNSRVWEGSLIAKRSALSIYPSLGKEEDTKMVDFMLKHHACSLVDAPTLYCYCITGANTFGQSHFDNMLKHASQVIDVNESQKIISSLDCFSVLRRKGY